MKKILISACLVGLDTRYDGKNSGKNIFSEMVKSGYAVPFCPEQAGGLPTPRDPSEIIGGDGIDVLNGKARVITDKGCDVTEKFIKGAEEMYKLAKILHPKKAILKSKSPSCGCKQIYDGTFTCKLREGMGVTAAFLKNKGIEVIDSDEVLREVKCKS